MEKFNMNPGANNNPVEKKEEKKTTSLKEKFKNAFRGSNLRKGALIAMTTAALGASAQNKSNRDDAYFSPNDPHNNKNIVTKEKIKNYEHPRLKAAFPPDEMVQGIPREEFDSIVIKDLAHRMGKKDVSEFRMTVEHQLEILLYERFSEIIQTKKGFEFNFGEYEGKFFDRDGNLKEDFWSEDISSFVDDLKRKITETSAVVNTNSAMYNTDGTPVLNAQTGEQMYDTNYPGAIDAATIKGHNLSDAKKAVGLLMK